MCGWPRFVVAGVMSEGIGESIPYACQDWANTKAAYRFFSNDDVSEDQILAGHFQTAVADCRGRTKFLCSMHLRIFLSAGEGFPSWPPGPGFPRQGQGWASEHFTTRGILSQQSAITLAGLPLGPNSHQVLDPPTVQKGAFPEKEDQSNTRADRREGELSVAGNLRQSTALYKQPRDCSYQES